MNLNYAHIGELCSHAIHHRPAVPPEEQAIDRIVSAYKAIITAEIEEVDPEYNKTGPAQYIDKALRDVGLDPELTRISLGSMHPRADAQNLIKACPTASSGRRMMWNPDWKDGERTISVPPPHKPPPSIVAYGTIDVLRTRFSPELGSQATTLVARFYLGSDSENEPISQRLDMLSLAVFANMLHQCEAVEIERVWPSTFVSRLTKIDTIESWDLDDIEQRVRRLWANKNDGELTPGAHCTRCPLRWECSASTSPKAKQTTPEPEPWEM